MAAADAYLAARTEFSNTSAELKKLAGVIATVASSLQTNPLRFLFGNQAVGLPAEASMSKDSRSVDANSWPTVEQIMRLLERYHQQKSDLERAWSVVPQNLRDGLKSPDDLIPGRTSSARGY